MTVNKLANQSSVQIDPAGKCMLPLSKSPSGLVLSEQSTTKSSVLGVKLSPTAVDCDVDEDTQSVTSDDESVYIDHDLSESARELDSMLSRYLSIELHPKGDDAFVLGSLFDDSDDESRTRRRVCIAENPVTSEVLCTYHANPFPLDPSEFHEQWYTPAEFQQFRHNNQKATKVARRSKCISDFTFIYEACGSSDKYRALTPLHKRVLSETEYRGLESSLLFGIILTDRKAYIRQILKTQKQHGSLDRWTFHECAEALAVQARFMTAKARRLAQVLGAGDAIVVAAMNGASHTVVAPLAKTMPANRTRGNTRPRANVPVVAKDMRETRLFEV